MLGQWLRDRFAALQRPLQSGTALLRQHRVLRQREHGTRLNPVGSLLLLESLAPPPLARCGLRDTLADIRPCLVLYLYIYTLLKWWVYRLRPIRAPMPFTLAEVAASGCRRINRPSPNHLILWRKADRSVTLYNIRDLCRQLVRPRSKNMLRYKYRSFRRKV